jgi:hypothetical protein
MMLHPQITPVELAVKGTLVLYDEANRVHFLLS